MLLINVKESYVSVLTHKYSSVSKQAGQRYFDSHNTDWL